MARTAKASFTESELTKGQIRKLNALRKSIGEEIAHKAFADWLTSSVHEHHPGFGPQVLPRAENFPDTRSTDLPEFLTLVYHRAASSQPLEATKANRSTISELEHEQLALALVDGDGGVQKFLDGLAGIHHFHEHVHDGVPAVILNEAFDDVDGVHGRSLADLTPQLRELRG